MRLFSASNFVQFLIKICFIPVQLTEDRIVFKFVSWRTLVHILVYYGWNIIGSIVIGLPLLKELLSNMQGRPQWGGRGGTGHPWDFNISETGDTIHQIRWHTWAWVKTQSLKSDLIQTNYFPILLATLNVFVNIQFSALFDL